jgi:hypothetical protein
MTKNINLKQMKQGNFMDIISIHYKEIKMLFRKRIQSKKQSFDEDCFNDAFIKCAQRFGNKTISYDEAVKYFWVAYVNTYKGSHSKASREFIESIDGSDFDCIDDEDPSYAKYVYDIVMTTVSEVFGEDDMMVYSLYKYYGWSENELIDAGYDCKDLNNRIKTIHKFVKSYCKKNMSR